MSSFLKHPGKFALLLSFAILGGASLQGQNSSGEPDAPEGLRAPQGDPLETVREIEGSSGKLALTLRYQGDEGDYLVFYGKRGEPLYLRYREDRFDYRTRHIAENLLPGRIYRVTFRYPEGAEQKRYPGLLRSQTPLKKGVYLFGELVLPSNYRF